jgi:hypothetical protein
LNDTSEQRLFEQLVRSRIEARLKTASSKTRKRMRLWSERSSGHKAPFIVCFSQDGGNRLSQWRGYAAQGGVSIGFKATQLEAFCKQKVTDGFGLSLRPVLYVKPEGEEVTNQIIDHLVKIDFDAISPEAFAEKVPQVLTAYFSVAIKHLAFAEENESRLVLFQKGETLQHRVRGSLIVGPSIHKKQTAEAIKNMLAIKGWGSVKVTCSDMPYRGW